MANNLFRVQRGVSLTPQASPPASPINGDMYYDSTLGSFIFYDNGVWINLASQADVAGATTLNSVQFTPAVVQNSLVRVTGSTAANIYGLTASTGGKQVVLYNASSAAVIIFSQDVNEPTASNRFATENDTPVSLAPGAAIISMYDSSAGRWIIASGSGGGSGGGIAEEVAIPNGNNSLAVTFPTPLFTASYSVIAQIVNTIDTNPEYIPVIITNKTINGFTASWNAPVDSANYSLDYIVPGVNQQFGEFILNSGTISVTVSFPIPLSSTSYVVISEIVNLVDPGPQYPPVTITNKTVSGFTARWNAPLDSANYRLAYQVAEFQS